MATSEKLLYTCRNAMPLRPRVCYGMTLSDNAAVTVRASRSSGGTVRQVVLTPDGIAARRQELAEAARSGGATTGCLAVHESLTLWLNSPLVSQAKAQKILPSLLDIQLPFPLEDCLYQFVEFRRTTAGTVSALVCAARREAIRACLDRYQAQGADPMLLDHEGLALWTQSLAECPARNATHPPAKLRQQPMPHRALIYMANDHTTLVIGHGERYGNAHSLQMTAASTADNGLINRLQLLLHADLPEGAGVQWLFSGAHAAETTVVEMLHRSLSKDWPGPLTRHKEPASFLARALCERALKRGPLRCNLRRLNFTHSAVRRAEDGRARAAAVGILVAGILLAGFSLASHLLGERRFDRIKAEIAAVAGELAPGVAIPYGREIPEVQKAWEKQALLTAPFLDAFAPSLATRLAAIVKAGQASAVRFENLSLRRNSLTLTGVAEDWDQCGQLEQRLKALGYAVKLQRQEAIAENEVRFTVNAEGGGP